MSEPTTAPDQLQPPRNVVRPVMYTPPPIDVMKLHERTSALLSAIIAPTPNALAIKTAVIDLGNVVGHDPLTAMPGCWIPTDLNDPLPPVVEDLRAAGRVPNFDGDCRPAR